MNHISGIPDIRFLKHMITVGLKVGMLVHILSAISWLIMASSTHSLQHLQFFLINRSSSGSGKKVLYLGKAKDYTLAI